MNGRYLSGAVRWYTAKISDAVFHARQSGWDALFCRIGNCSEPTSKMLRISSVWRIRQIKFQKQAKNASIFRLFYEILLGSEQLRT